MPRRRLDVDDRGDDRPLLPDLKVYEPEEEEDTGVLDMHGNRILKPRRSIGFTVLRERDC